MTIKLDIFLMLSVASAAIATFQPTIGPVHLLPLAVALLGLSFLI